MTGSNPEIIIPHKNTTITPHLPEIIEPPKTTSETQPLDVQTKREIYIPDSTRILLNKVLEELSMYVRQDQIADIAIILSNIFNNMDCVKVKKRGDAKKRREFLLQDYLDALVVEGKSKKTIGYYKSTICALFDYYPDKHVEDLTTEDIRKYLFNRMTYAPQEDPHILKYGIVYYGKKWTKRSADNIRRILNVFFKWLVSERIILFNPLDPIKKIKHAKKIKQPFTAEDVMRLRDACRDTRDRAIVEFLLSTGCRAGEVVGVKISDINWQDQEVVVKGKGDKERYVYLNDICIHYLKKYLDERDDGIDHLFVTLNAEAGGDLPNPLGQTGFGACVRELGARAGVKDVHPHRFRHTFATTALNKGIPLEQIQQMMGHENIDTTLIYAKVAHDEIKYAHKKYLNY